MVSVLTLGLRRGVAVILGGAVLSCGGEGATTKPSNDLLIIGYDREPDTLNRFSTNILEDVQTCVIEGLVTTDCVPNDNTLLAAFPYLGSPN